MHYFFPSLRAKRSNPKASGKIAGLLRQPNGFLAMTMTLICLLPAPAFAVCSNPSGAEGKMIYNEDHSTVQYCDGTNWVATGRTADLPAIPTYGLVGHWKLDESSGTTATDSAGSNNGTLTNMNSGTDWVTGNIGNALDFDGSNDYVSIADNAALDFEDSSFTISVWAKPWRIDTLDQTIISKATSFNDGNVNYNIKDGYGAGWCFITSDMSGTYSHRTATCSDESYIEDQWILFTGVHEWNGSSGHQYFYVNGTLVDDAPTNYDVAANSGPLTIGSHTTGSGRFQGVIDDVRIYNRALSADEVAALAATNLNTGLVGHWKLDETSGTTATDSSGYGNNGTMEGGLDASNDSVPGKIGTAIRFDGSNDRIAVPASETIGGLASSTYCAWIYPTGWGGGGDGSIFSKDADYCGEHHFMYLDETDKTVQSGYTCYGTQNPGASATSNTISLNEWAHLCVVFNRDSDGDIHIYKDGLEVSYAVTYTTDKLDAPEDLVYDLVIGRYYGGGNGFDGYLDDLRLYNRALSNAEIHQLYSCPAPGKIIYNSDEHRMQFCSDQGVHPMGPVASGSGGGGGSTNLVGHWKLDETSGTTAADSSDNGHDGTMQGSMNATNDTVAGQVGTALDFDGNNDRINITDHADFTLSASGKYTWVMWIKSDSLTQNGGWPTLFSHTIDSSNYVYFYAQTVSNGDLPGGSVTSGITAWWWTGSAKIVTEAESVVTTGNWYHIAITYDGTQSSSNRFKIYVNSVDQTGSSSTSGSVSNVNPSYIRIGSNQPYGEYFNGQMDDVRFYDRLLSPTEISNLYTGFNPAAECSSPTHLEGTMIYNDDDNVMQYCNGTDWVGIGK